MPPPSGSTGHTPDPWGFRDGAAWIDYRGPPGTIPTVSFAEVVHDRVTDAQIRNRIVVVGATAPTLRDVHSTPVGGEELMPGAEVQANAIWTALDGLPLRSAAPATNLLILILLAMLPPLRAGASRSAPWAPSPCSPAPASSAAPSSPSRAARSST